MMDNFIRTYLLGMLLLLCSGCVRQREPQTVSGKLRIIVSILPQKYFVERICGEWGAVKTLIPPGASPHTFEPKPSQMEDIAHADLYFSIGVEMEKVWLPKIKALRPNLKVVATDSGITKLHSKEQGEHHDHGDAHEEGYDPHIWLSPLLVKEQARAIAKALCSADSAHCDSYMQNLESFEAEIDSLRAYIIATLAGCPSQRTFMTFHPSWGYFAQEFSLTQISVESGGREPGMREVGAIAAQARKYAITTILVQPQFSRRLAKTIAEHLGGQVVEADPMAENWSNNIKKIAEILCK